MSSHFINNQCYLIDFKDLFQFFIFFIFHFSFFIFHFSFYPSHHY